MQMLNQGDPVLILPKFAHLFPGNSANIVTVNANESRPMLNEYTVEFPDRSTAKLFQFQIIEGLPSYTTTIARVIFDSRAPAHQAQIRGRLAGFQLVFQTPEFDLDMRIHATTNR